jgi:hypothetical protein
MGVESGQYGFDYDKGDKPVLKPYVEQRDDGVQIRSFPTGGRCEAVPSPDGKTQTETTYDKDGKLVSTATIYLENGQPVRKIYFNAEGKKHLERRWKNLGGGWYDVAEIEVFPDGRKIAKRRRESSVGSEPGEWEYFTDEQEDQQLTVGNMGGKNG